MLVLCVIQGFPPKYLCFDTAAEKSDEISNPYWNASKIVFSPAFHQDNSMHYFSSLQSALYLLN